MGFLSFRLPQSEACLLCHDSGADKGLCDACLKDLHVSASDAANVCPRCGGTGAGAAVCGQCQKEPPPFERLWASVEYAPPVSGILHRFKHRRDRSLAAPLVSLMASLPPPWLDDVRIDTVLAMPLSRERRLFRGFNQCDELAEALAKLYGWQVLPHNSVFRQASAPQSTLPFEARKKNVRGAFRVDACVKERNVLLIDDVLTSGETLRECSRMLRRSGSGSVFCWTLAISKLKIF
ncbi:ComF family protein [Neisseria canis]|uniref:ComF family protein n=1 Tax=Neisseria canis TaxID=493 RepID=UPI000A196554|nr:ComF family protein [Neisseria canis]OSI11029.1 competence protein [Neisseria canis]